MKKIIFMMFSLGFLLASCGANTNNASVSEIKDSKTTILPANNSTGATSSGIASISTPGKIDREVIEKIQTLDDLKKLNPNVMQTPGNSHPKFVTLQKNQMLLGTYLSEIKDAKYLGLLKKQADISQGRELWPKELQDLDSEFRSIIGHSITAGSGSTQFQEVLDKKNVALKIFYASSAYKQYIQTHTKELDDIDTSIKSYWTPRMLELQKTVASLAQEVYASGVTR